MLGIAEALPALVTTILYVIGKGGIFMTENLLVVGTCGVKITSENQSDAASQIGHTVPEALPRL